MIVIALSGVKHDLKLPADQMKLFEAAMLAWWKRHKRWPDGF
jgi:hypothetical protein